MEGSEAFNGFPGVGVTGRGSGRVVCVCVCGGGGRGGGGSGRGAKTGPNSKHWFTASFERRCRKATQLGAAASLK